MDQESTRGEVTRLIAAARRGEPEAVGRLYPVVYDELRGVAARQLRRERPGHTLHPAALVHEAYLKMAGSPAEASDRAHFLALAARAMRQILVDHARRRGAQKRGGTGTPPRSRTALRASSWIRQLIALDRAIETLEERQRQVVECRFFGGMEETEIAEALNTSERTVRRDWVKVRAWLY